MKSLNVQHLTGAAFSLYIAIAFSLAFCDKYQTFILIAIIIYVFCGICLDFDGR